MGQLHLAQLGLEDVPCSQEDLCQEAHWSAQVAQHCGVHYIQWDLCRTHTCRLSRWCQWVWRNSEGQHSEQGGLLGMSQLEKVAHPKEEMFEGLNIGLLFEQECISPKMCNLFTSCILHILPMDFVGLDSKDPMQCIQACYLHQIQWLHCCMMT